MKVAIIPTDTAEPIRFEETNGGLSEWYRLIDCQTIDIVGLEDGDDSVAMDLIVDDEALLSEPVLNVRATILYRKSVGPEYADQVAIFGTAVAASVDRNGNTRGLNQKQVRHLEGV